MKILGRKIISGRRNYLEIYAAALYTRTRIKVPIIVEKGKLDGPTLLVMGGIHGDEVNGIEIVRRLLYEKLVKPKRGAVIYIPIVNVMAFLNMDRRFADGRDLNRSFPGNSNGSLASKVAHSITTKILPHADFVIDLHTGADERFNHPQIRYDLTHEKNIELAKAFNAPFTLLQNKAPKGSVRHVLNENEIPVIIFEGGKSVAINNSVVETGLTGVLNVIDYLNICKKKNTGEKSAETIFLHENRWLRAGHSGMLEVKVENGSFVKKGNLLGYINGPYAQFQKKIKSPMDGYIFCINQNPVVHLGDAIFHIGKEIKVEK